MGMKFEDLDAWKNARILVQQIYRITEQPSLSRDFGLRDQIQRSSVSVMTNIAEGFERTSLKEKTYFYNIARASCGETRYLLYVTLDTNKIDQESFTQLRNLSIQIGKQLSGLIRSTESRS